MRVGELQYLAVAAVLHLAIPAAAAIAPRTNIAQFALASTAREHVELEVDMSDFRLPTEERYLDQLPVDAQRMAARTRSRTPYDPSRPSLVPPSDTSNPMVTPHDPDTPAPFRMAPDPGVDAYNLPPSRDDVDGAGNLPVGLGGAPIWQMFPGAVPRDQGVRDPAPTQAPKRKYHHERAARLLPDGMRHNDKELGLDFPGLAKVKRVVISAVTGSDAPFECSGSFSITVNKTGHVTAVAHHGHVGGDAATWASIRQRISAELKGSQFPLRAAFKEKGAIIGVAIRSQMRMPSGSGSREGATFSFDVSNAGERPRRVVSAGATATPVR